MCWKVGWYLLLSFRFKAIFGMIKLNVPRSKEFFRTCNVKDPRYMQNKKDPRISLPRSPVLKPKLNKIIVKYGSPIWGKIVNNSNFIFISIFYNELELQSCFAPEYEIIGEFEKFYFLSLEVLVFSISKTSSLQIKTQVCRVISVRLWNFKDGGS